MLQVISTALAGFLLSLQERAADIIAVILIAGATCCSMGAWVHLLRTRCPRCHELALVKGSIWFGSSWGALGSKCVHCGLNLTREL